MATFVQDGQLCSSMLQVLLILAVAHPALFVYYLIPMKWEGEHQFSAGAFHLCPSFWICTSYWWWWQIIRGFPSVDSPGMHLWVLSARDHPYCHLSCCKKMGSAQMVLLLALMTTRYSCWYEYRTIFLLAFPFLFDLPGMCKFLWWWYVSWYLCLY